MKTLKGIVRLRRGILIVLIFVVVLGYGCATQSKTTTTEISTYPQSGVAGTEQQFAEQPVVIEKETTTTTETSDSHGGVLSTTFDVMGEIIALPFRIVGGLFSAIF